MIMWRCSLELVDDCAGRGLWSAPKQYRGEDVCRACLEAVGPGADPADDFPATDAYAITD